MKLMGALEVTSWQEDDVRTFDDGAGKITRATIGYRLTGGIVGDALSDVVMYYRPDGTAAVVGLWRVTGSAAGRFGSVVFESTGGYDGTAAVSHVRAVIGSGTGELTTVAASGTTTATSSEADYVLDVEF